MASNPGTPHDARSSPTKNSGLKTPGLNPSVPPEHLSEFYSFMNNKSAVSVSPQGSPSSRGYPSPEFKGKRFNRQPSLNTFTSFTPSVLDLPNIVTMKDFNGTVDAYETMLAKSAKLQRALHEVSLAASEFGQALEDTITECPKVNNPKLVADGIINAGSLQYIVGSNHQILGRLLDQNFHQPLQAELEKLKQDYHSNYTFYQQEVKDKSRALRAKELENIKLSKSKTRNLTVYKSNLVNLTNQLDEIDRLKYDYYHEVNTMIERFNQDHLLSKTGSLVRAELELFETIARKGWSGGGLDQLLAVAPDIFAEDEDEPKQLQDAPVMSRVRTTESIIEEESDPDETLETVRLNTESLALGPSLEHPDTQTASTPKETPPLLDEDQRDESFSLPKISNNSLVNKKSPESDRIVDEIDYTKQNVLDNLD